MMPPQGERQPAPDAPRRAFIPLSHKRVPTEMRAPSDHVSLLYAALVASDVDIMALRNHIVSLPDEQWQEAYNRKHNVYFQRPFHDKLGVNNIMCLFSDTQLHNVYELPFYQTYKRFLEPIFARMNVHPDQVVRCLFARMPGETLIPPHHDNGPWVSKTHRIHVPIVTFADVEFKSGGLSNSMTRYAFNEGTIVELNNAAKHSVWNPSKRHRVHLIFDYVEQPQRLQLTRHVLSPGQLCRQVRGRVELIADGVDKEDQEKARRAANMHHSEMETLVKERIGADAATRLVTACRHYFIEQIDTKAFAKIVRRTLRGQDDAFADTVWGHLVEMFGLVDALARRELLEAKLSLVYAPNWVIIGAQKCGTTSLYEYMSQHPQVCKGKRREPHFFDWQWEAALKFRLPPAEDTVYKKILDEYAAVRSKAGAEEPESSLKLDDLRGNSLDDLRAKYLASLQIDNPATVFCPPIQTGESTPSYLLYGERVARHMYQLYPNMKLIVMLRDPVKRAFSHYQMTADPNGTLQQLKMREPVKGKSFEQVVDEDLALLADASVSSELLDAVDCEVVDRFQQYADSLSQQHGAHSYVGRGLYALQIALWLRVYPRDQLLIIDLDAMKTPEGTRKIANEAFAFLEVEPHEVEDAERKNTRAYGAVDPVVAQRLRDFYAPYNEQLFELIGRRFNW